MADRLLSVDSETKLPPQSVIDALAGEIGGTGGGAVDSVNGQTGTVVLDAGDVGLGNVDNTSDANKPVSTATAAAIAANGPGVVAVLGPADPIPGGTPPGLIVRLAE